MQKPTIGFIGLGQMGSQMVQCLQNNGYDLVVMGRKKAATDLVIARGGKVVETPKKLAESSDIIMLCVTTSDVVESLIYGNDGILAGIKPDSILIDYGTSIPSSTQKIGADLSNKGVGMIDAPLGRTPAHARDGMLNIMAGGERNTFDKVKAILEVQGENVFYLGDLGAGHVTKLINNFMGMTTVCAMSQAFAIAQRAGVNCAQLHDIMSSGPSNSPFMAFCKKYVVDGVSDLGFSIENANKDVNYFLDLTKNLGARSEIAEGTSNNLGAAVAAGLGEKNVPEIYDMFLKNG